MSAARYYYVSEEMARRRSPKGSIYLASAELVQPQSKHEHYFEVHCKQSDLSFQLRAQCAILRAQTLFLKKGGLMILAR